MLRRREPRARDLDEFLICHPRMRCEGEFVKRLEPQSEERVVILLDDGLEGLPLG